MQKFFSESEMFYTPAKEITNYIDQLRAHGFDPECKYPAPKPCSEAEEFAKAILPKLENLYPNQDQIQSWLTGEPIANRLMQFITSSAKSALPNEGKSRKKLIAQTETWLFDE